MKEYSIDDIREEISSHRKNIVQQERLEDLYRKDGEAMQSEQVLQLFELREKNNLVNKWLCLLCEDEAYVIRRHLVDGISWPRIEMEYAKRWGQFSKCARTLMRYQKHALLRIYQFMNE